MVEDGGCGGAEVEEEVGVDVEAEKGVDVDGQGGALVAQELHDGEHESVDVGPEVTALGGAYDLLVDVSVEGVGRLHVATQAGLDQRRLDILQRRDGDLRELVVIGFEK